jgi:serine phosphatase RsbU (regulator of sigma subunit)
MRLHVEPPFGPPFDHELEAGEVIMGRSAAAGLVINDASVSRQHAKFVRRDGDWWLEDLGATNRTHLNGELIDGSARLSPGDRLRLGGTTIHVLGDGVLPTPPPLVGDDTDRQAARLRILNDVHKALATAIALPELLQLILDRSFEVLKPEEGLILLRGPGGELERAATRRLAGLEGEVFVSRHIIDEVAGRARPVLLLDAALDERFAGVDSIVSSGVRSVLAAPLTDAAGTIGLIALCSRASVRQFSDQDLDMLMSLASAAVLRVRNVALAEEAAARKVLEHELAIAHDIQMAMLPRDWPDRPEVALAARLQPAQSVGGDLYDFVLDGDRLWFIVGDVAGKGVAAALYMAVAKTLFRATTAGATCVEDVVARMNRELSRDNERQTFVTAVIGSLDLTSGDVSMIDAGHMPVVVAGADGRILTPVLTKCLTLGVLADHAYVESRLRLTPGATLFLYTDGVTDARNGSGVQFGADRLLQAIAAGAGQGPDAIVNGVARAIGRFESGGPPEDDVTMLAVQYRG